MESFGIVYSKQIYVATMFIIVYCIIFYQLQTIVNVNVTVECQNYAERHLAPWDFSEFICNLTFYSKSYIQDH